MPKLQLSKERHHLTIPTEFVRLLGWRKGTALAVYPGKEERTLLIKEMPKVNE